MYIQTYGEIKYRALVRSVARSLARPRNQMKDCNLCCSSAYFTAAITIIIVQQQQQHRASSVWIPQLPIAVMLWPTNAQKLTVFFFSRRHRRRRRLHY